METSSQYRSRDRVLPYAAAALAALVVVLAAWVTVDRLADVARGQDIPVAVPLTPEQGAIVLGWALDTVDVDQGGSGVHVTSLTVPMSDPSSRLALVLWAEPIVAFLAVASGALVASALLRRFARGDGLERGSARLVFLGAGIAAGGWLTTTLLRTIAADEVRERLFDNAHEAGPFPIEPGQLAWSLLLGSVGVALLMGERLRRETKGLV